MDAHIPRNGAVPSMTMVQSISQSPHHQPSPLPTTLTNGITGGPLGAGQSLPLGTHNPNNPNGIALSAPHMNIYSHNSPLPPAPLPVSFVLPPSSASTLLPHPHHPVPTSTPSLTTTFNGLTLRSSEEEVR